MVIDAEYEEVGSGAARGEGELDLSEAASLPWLESDEDDAAAGTVDTSQILAFAGILLAVLLAVVGGIYFITNRTADPELVADGSIIAAPEGPIKERPEDPGGREFAGTGDVAPGVGEGKVREAQIGADKPVKIVKTDAAPEPAPSPSPASSPSAPAAGAYVQLAAYGSRARAEAGWADLSRQTAALSGRSHRVVEAVVGGATVYRLQIPAGDRASASQLCSAIKADGLECAVK